MPFVKKMFKNPILSKLLEKIVRKRDFIEILKEYIQKRYFIGIFPGMDSGPGFSLIWRPSGPRPTPGATRRGRFFCREK